VASALLYQHQEPVDIACAFLLRAAGDMGIVQRVSLLLVRSVW
jgi:hypothetical protein